MNRPVLISFLVIAFAHSTSMAQNIQGVLEKAGGYYYAGKLKSAAMLVDSALAAGTEYPSQSRFDLLTFLAYIQLELKDQQGSIISYRKALEINPQSATDRGNLGWTYYESGKLDSAILETEQALDVDSSMGWAWANLGLYRLALGEKEKALEDYWNAWLTIEDHDEQTWSSVYADLDDLASLRPDRSDDIKRVTNNLRALSFPMRSGRTSPARAETALMDMLESRRRDLPAPHPFLALSITKAAVFYREVSRFEIAETLFTEALVMSRNCYRGDHTYLAVSINNLAVFYNDLGRYTEAEPLYTEALAMLRRIYKGDHANLPIVINNVATFYFEQGRFKEAEKLFGESLVMSRKLQQGDHFSVALSLGHMAMIHQTEGRLTEAEQFYREAVAMYRRLFPGNSPYLATSINNLALFYKEQGKFEEAEPLYREALDRYRRLARGDHPALAAFMDNMAALYCEMGRFRDADSMFTETDAMYRRLYRGDNIDLVKSLNNRANCCQKQGREEEAEPMIRESLRMLLDILASTFTSLSEREREQFYTSVLPHIESYFSFAVKDGMKRPVSLALLFDLRIRTKGLLLESLRNLRRNISASGDSTLIGLFDRWTRTREQLARLFGKTGREMDRKGVKHDSLELAVNSLEKELGRRSDDFARSRKQPSWRDVQAALNPAEAVVEVIRIDRFDGKRTGAVHYAVLIVHHGTKDHPELVMLENGNDLETKSLSRYRETRTAERAGTRDMDDETDIELYKRFWQQIDNRLAGIQRIYISPDGVYNLINPATFRRPDGKYLLETLDIRLLTSARDLLFGFDRSTRKESLTASLYGAPAYELDESRRQTLAMAFPGNNIRSAAPHELDTLSRMRFVPLPNTAEEVKRISERLTEHGWKVAIRLGEEAIEEAVKAERGPKLLHVATHGYFLDDVEASKKERSGKILGLDAGKVFRNPLLRSGLAFAGAKQSVSVHRKNTSRSTVDDGLLTAYEAMSLNLSGTELVVLSACETGLGEVRNGEGVYGLQRALQAAGAQSVLMSLWQVSDVATLALMTAFYGRWLKNGDIHEALRETQIALMEKYPEPYYWGAFLMSGR